MNAPPALFLKSIDQSVKDKDMHKKIAGDSARYQLAFEEGKKQYAQLETAKERAAFIRAKVIENLDKYLIEFEANFIKGGGKVIWARNAEEATEEILKITDRFREGGILTAKNMLTEEIGLNAFLEKNGHKIIEDEEDDSSGVLQEKYLTASVGITGADFIIAEPGAIAIAENESNAVLASAMPTVHIVVAAIDKVIPSLNDLDLFLPLLSTFTNGQPLTTYNTVITGPDKANEGSSPSEMYVVLVDNGRTKVMADETARQALYCINCNACLHTDPVYFITGGNKHGNIYHGPYGAAVLPYKEELKEYISLSEIHPLDGRSTDACPVNIDFNKILLHNRKIAVDNQFTTKSEKWFYFFWKKAMLKRNRISLTGVKTLGYFVNSTFNKSEKGLRNMRDIPSKSFNEIWREKSGR